MKYLMLVAALFLSGCSLFDFTVSKDDIVMANCICKKHDKGVATMIMREGGLIQFRCDNRVETITHYDRTYTAGCTPEPSK